MILQSEQNSTMTIQIQQEYFICIIISSKIQRRRWQKRIEQNSFFTQICFQFSCGFAGNIEVLRFKTSKTQCDWIDYANNQKLQLLPLWCATILDL